MKKIKIHWGGVLRDCCRIVVSRTVKELALIRQQADRLGIPVVIGHVPLKPNDLWVGLSPSSGYGDNVAETFWAQSFQAELVVQNLRLSSPAAKESQR